MKITGKELMIGGAVILGGAVLYAAYQKVKKTSAQVSTAVSVAENIASGATVPSLADKVSQTAVGANNVATYTQSLNPFNPFILRDAYSAATSLANKLVSYFSGKSVNDANRPTVYIANGQAVEGIPKFSQDPAIAQLQDVSKSIPKFGDFMFVNPSDFGAVTAGNDGAFANAGAVFGYPSRSIN